MDIDVKKLEDVKEALQLPDNFEKVSMAELQAELAENDVKCTVNDAK
ncbi:MAG: hypothetical protein GX760_05270 [Erysipelothrix sp.]|nr:hypothetical protein [Erysipelothrix sp.]